jgi:hypothetical protein
VTVIQQGHTARAWGVGGWGGVMSDAGREPAQQDIPGRAQSVGVSLLACVSLECSKQHDGLSSHAPDTYSHAMLCHAVLCCAVQNVWGRADPGDMVALMGPSGETHRLATAAGVCGCAKHTSFTYFQQYCIGGGGREQEEQKEEGEEG